MDAYKTAIRNKVIELARKLKIDASDLKDDDVIPEMGYLDSASIIALILWYEEHFGFELDLGEITVDSFGTVNAMAAFAQSRLNAGQ